jgi:hypothetical protein
VQGSNLQQCIERKRFVLDNVFISIVLPWNPPVNDERSSSTLSKEEIIAVIAGVGGFLLIVILVLFLCLIRRRQKPKRGKMGFFTKKPAQVSSFVFVKLKSGCLQRTFSRERGGGGGVHILHIRVYIYCIFLY